MRSTYEVTTISWTLLGITFTVTRALSLAEHHRNLLVYISVTVIPKVLRYRKDEETEVLVPADTAELITYSMSFRSALDVF